MPEQLQADLELDTSGAEAAAQALGDAIDQALSEGAAAGISALEDALGGITASAVEVPIEADVSGAQDAIDGLTAQPVDVPVGADVSEAEGAIQGITADPVVVDVEADTSAAEADIAGLGDTAGSASGNLDSLGSSGASAAGGMNEAGAGAAAAGAAIGGAGSSALTAAAGITGAAFGFHELFSAGIEASTGVERLRAAAGPLADSIQHIQIGSLNTSLSDLGHQFGSTGAEMDNAAAKAFQFATAGGFSAQKSGEFAQGIAALAARAVALNPSLGSIATVADTMSTSFGRVLLAAKKYNLALSQSEVNQQAFADTGKTASNQLTVQEKAVAAVEVATRKYGGTLSTTIATGADLAANRLKSLSATAKDVAETLGVPLANAALGSLEKLQGPVETILHAFQQLPGPVQAAAAAFLAFGVAAQLPLVGPAIRGIGEGIGTLVRNVGSMSLTSAPSFSLMATAAAGVGIAIGTLGVEEGNTTKASLGLAAGFAAVGFQLGGPLGAGIGAAVGGLVGFAAAMHSSGNEVEPFDAAVKNLHDHLGANVPVLADLIQKVQITGAAANVATQGFQQQTGTIDVWGNKIKDAGGAFESLTTHQQEHDAQQRVSKALNDEFNASLAKSPEAALAFISAADRMGVSTQKFSLELTNSVQTAQLMQQAQAAVATGAEPLAASFKQSATAAGQLTLTAFDAGNALVNMVDKQDKAAKAADAYNAALKSNDQGQIRTAATAEAAAASQAAFAETLFRTQDAQAAAKAGTDALRGALVNMRDAPGVSPQTVATLNDLIHGLDVASVPRSAKLDLNVGDSLIKAQGIKAAIDDLAHPRQMQLDLRATAALDTTGQVQRALDTLTRVPYNVRVQLLQDISSGDIPKLTADLDKLGAKTVTPKVDADTAPAQQKIDGVLHFADGSTGTLKVDANPDPATGRINATIQFADGSKGTITIDGNTGLAYDKTGQAVGHVNSSSGAITIDGKEVFKRGDYGVIGSAQIAITANVNAAFGSVIAGAKAAAGGAGGITIPAGGLQGGGVTGGLSLLPVGERGPELALLPGGTRVLNNTQTRTIAQERSGGYGDVNIAIDARGATQEAVAGLKRLDWRDVGRLINQEQQASSFLKGRR